MERRPPHCKPTTSLSLRRSEVSRSVKQEIGILIGPKHSTIDDVSFPGEKGLPASSHGTHQITETGGFRQLWDPEAVQLNWEICPVDDGHVTSQAVRRMGFYQADGWWGDKA